MGFEKPAYRGLCSKPAGTSTAAILLCQTIPRSSDFPSLVRSSARLTFFDVPAAHRDHLRTSNPVESVFATVRHRTLRPKRALSQKIVKLMVFTLVRAAAKKWRCLKGANQLPCVIDGVKFTNGVADRNPAKTNAA